MRVALFVSAIFILFVLRELVTWYVFFEKFGAWAGIAYVVGVLGLVSYFVVLPIWNIFALPSFGTPVENPSEKQKRQMLERRGRILGLSRSEVKSRGEAELLSYIHKEIARRSEEAAAIRRKHVTVTFIGTAASQSAVVDLFVVISAALKVTWKTFQVYGVRTPLKDTLAIFREIAVGGALGASEIAETGGEVFSHFAFKSFSKFPAWNFFVECLADGLVNSYLVCRIAMIAENYCATAYTEKAAHWQPTVKATYRATFDILHESGDQIRKALGPSYKWAIDLLFRRAKSDAEPAAEESSEQKGLITKLTEYFNKWRTGPETT